MRTLFLCCLMFVSLSAFAQQSAAYQYKGGYEVNLGNERSKQSVSSSYSSLHTNSIPATPKRPVSKHKNASVSLSSLNEASPSFIQNNASSSPAGASTSQLFLTSTHQDDNQFDTWMADALNALESSAMSWFDNKGGLGYAVHNRSMRRNLSAYFFRSDYLGPLNALWLLDDWSFLLNDNVVNEATYWLLIEEESKLDNE